MSKYIDADRLIRRLENRPYKAVPNFIKMVEEQEAADVVSRGVLEQVMWERDLAISQLAEIGKGLGAKMDDVVEVKHGRWKPFDLTWGRSVYACTSCGEAMEVPTECGKPMYEFCPCCGALMDKDKE